MKICVPIAGTLPDLVLTRVSHSISSSCISVVPSQRESQRVGKLALPWSHQQSEPTAGTGDRILVRYANDLVGAEAKRDGGLPGDEHDVAKPGGSRFCTLPITPPRYAADVLAVPPEPGKASSSSRIRCRAT
jgi:hypothetical protein